MTTLPIKRFQDLPQELQVKIFKLVDLHDIINFVRAVSMPYQGLISHFNDSTELFFSHILSMLPSQLPVENRALINLVEIFHPQLWDMDLLIDQLEFGHNLFWIVGEGGADTEPIESSGWSMQSIPKEVTVWNPGLDMLMARLPKAHYSIVDYDTVVFHSQTFTSPVISFQDTKDVFLIQCKAHTKFRMFGAKREINLTLSDCDESLIQNLDQNHPGGGVTVLRILGDNLTLRDCTLSSFKFESGNIAGKADKTFKEITRVQFDGWSMDLDLSHDNVVFRSLWADNLQRLQLNVNRIMPPISGLSLPNLTELEIRNSVDSWTPIAPEGVVDYSFCKTVKNLKLTGIIDPLYLAPLDSLEELSVEYNGNLFGVTQHFRNLLTLKLKCGPEFRELGEFDAPILQSFTVERGWDNHRDHALDFVCPSALGFRQLHYFIVKDLSYGRTPIDSLILYGTRIGLYELTLEGTSLRLFNRKYSFTNLRSLNISGRHSAKVFKFDIEAPDLQDLVIHLHRQTVEVYGYSGIRTFHIKADDVIGDRPSPTTKGHKFTRCYNCGPGWDY